MKCGYLLHCPFYKGALKKIEANKEEVHWERNLIHWFCSGDNKTSCSRYQIYKGGDIPDDTLPPIDLSKL